MGKYIIVYMSDMNPCEYIIAILKGQGLCDSDHIKSFSNYVRRKIESLSFKDLPTSPNELIKEFDKSGPIPDLYNVIYATMYERNYKLNNHGYAVTDSVAIANKIWSVASDWQSLITRKPTPKQALIGLTLHRFTGSKEGADELHKFGHGISYDNIKKYNRFWGKSQAPVQKRLIKSIPLHSTIDNDDGCQETMTGSGTSHHTNSTFFQPLLPDESKEIATNSAVLEVRNETVTPEIPEYSLPAKARKDPSPFNAYIDNDSTDLLFECLKKDIAWSIANGEPGILPLLGSWTAFNRKVSEHKQKKSLIEFMPVISQPPKHDVCKYYLDILNGVIKDLGLNTYLFMQIKMFMQS